MQKLALYVNYLSPTGLECSKKKKTGYQAKGEMSALQTSKLCLYNIVNINVLVAMYCVKLQESSISHLSWYPDSKRTFKSISYY